MKKLHILDGYKTYILATLIGLASVAHSFGWIETQAYFAIMGILVPGALASMRQAITNNKS